ncbi:hypothetical protein [Wansuia hejianensis]|uniref:Uncharacterized protein n=1 Tax=Wansuia hejianensis TaxID=2763667 RepID=A0A926IMM8_9FIRM|nr:hypothetical protein [Wansuia hejianensis]MBC8590610.1 hypothetical protein [Wansuia hejianensis]
MWQDIYTELKEKNLNPYPPGLHKGLCEEPYVVIKEGTQIPSIQSNVLGQKVIDIIVFVPLSSYIAVDPYMKKVRSALKELSYLRKTGLETPIITDDDKKAYTSSIEYVIQKKLEG